MNAHAAAMRAIRRIAGYVQQAEFADDDREMITVRLERLEEAWTRFNDVHLEIVEAIVGDDVAIPEQNMAQIEELYIATKVAFRRRLELLRQLEVPAQVPPAGQQAIAVNVQMPFQQHDIKNTWGEFDGALTKWQGFHDRFVAAIHENAQVSPAFKFSYLKKSLTGRAARTLGEWQLTDENYQEAWERLNQLYNKKYPICREHLRQFIKLPVIQGQPRANDLQRMANVTQETLRQLRAQGIPVDHWDMIVVHMLHERLDSETAKQWELQRETETPTAADMTRFLDKQAAALEGNTLNQHSRSQESLHSERSNRSDRERPNRSESDKASQKQTGKMPAKKSASANSVPAAIGRRHVCEACSGEHQLYNCEDFKALNLRSRKDFVERRNLCTNCLKQGHAAANCYQGPCIRCPSRPMHNSILCPTKDISKPVVVATASGEKGAKRKTKDGTA